MLHADPGVVRPADVASVPWANGLGITRVLLERENWRISVAEIDGRAPFSELPGVSRVLIPVRGEGLLLRIDGRLQDANRGLLIAFRGEDPVTAETVSGPVSVVNLMVRRAAAAMDVRAGLPVPVAADADAVVVAGAGAAMDGCALEPGTVLLPGAWARLVAPDDAVVSVRIRALASAQ
ncbi:HutD family protein [Microbacterium sp. NPDC055903]